MRISGAASPNIWWRSSPRRRLFLKLLQPKRPLILPGRAIVLMLVTLLLGPGLVVENVLKDHSGRTRPVYVTAFGGTERFVPLWDFDGPCQTNCSFVAGEPAAAFWTLAAAAVTPPPWRTAAYVAAITFGVVVGLLRMAVGAHFFTDVVFAGIITFLIIWLVHGLLYRWAATRMTDEAIERAIERMATPLHDGLRQIAARFRRLAVNSKDGDLP